MPLINWTIENSVGIEEFDKQHQKLFSIINDLYGLMAQSKAQEGIKNVLDNLVSYADYHFQTEEKYFNQFDYEHKLEHILLHERYKERIAQFINESKENSETVVSYSILDFLEDWWLNHINIEDKGYTECFKGHGLK